MRMVAEAKRKEAILAQAAPAARNDSANPEPRSKYKRRSKGPASQGG